MTDQTTGLAPNTEDDDIEIIEEGAQGATVAPTGPADAGGAPPPPSAPLTDDDDDEDGDDGDARIATGSEEDDADLDAAEVKRRKRQRRRLIQKLARERSEQVIREQANIIEQLMGRVHQVEQVTVAGRAAQLEAEMAQVREHRAKAVSLRASAIKEGNEAAIAKLDNVIREIDREEARIEQVSAEVNQTLERISQQAPGRVPVGPQADVKAYADAWLRENPWFNPQGQDPASLITRQIDAAVAADGFRPDTPDYWLELTRRINAAARGGQQPQTGGKPATPARSASTPPPVASGRSVADGGASAGPKTFVLSAARKQAMIDAGIWDDPDRRKAQIRAFMTYDRDQAARQK